MFESTSLYFRVQDTDHFYFSESSYSVTCSNQTRSQNIMHKVLSGSPHTSVRAYKVIWFSITGEKYFGVAMLTSLDINIHYSVEEFIGSLGGYTLIFSMIIFPLD